jgi:hypothetical protein
MASVTKNPAPNPTSSNPATASVQKAVSNEFQDVSQRVAQSEFVPLPDGSLLPVSSDAPATLPPVVPRGSLPLLPNGQLVAPYGANLVPPNLASPNLAPLGSVGGGQFIPNAPAPFYPVNGGNQSYLPPVAPRGGEMPPLPSTPVRGGGIVDPRFVPMPRGGGYDAPSQRGGYETRPTIPSGSGQRINQSGFTSRLDSSHPKISAMADQVSGEFRVSSVALKAMILKEYGGEPDHENISGSNTTNYAGYNGPMQLSQTVVKECTPDFIAKYGRKPDSTAPLDNIRLGVIYAHHTTEGIDRRNVTVAELYGRHNQGARGYETLRANPNERAVDVYARNDIRTANIINNLPPGYKHLGSSITARQFIEGWRENIINASGGDYRFWQ